MQNPKFEEFRKKYPKFVYNDYLIEKDEKNITITYFFEIPNLSSFKPQIVIPIEYIKKCNENIDVSNNNFKNLVFNLGMIEAISYYKLTCSPNIVIYAGFLTSKQKKWFKKLIYNGLGEFMYVNNINISEEELVTITSSESRKLNVTENKNKLKGELIPIGGGKDSCVSLEILEKLREENTPFVINPRGATINTVKKAGYENKSIYVNRILDKNLIELNKQGFLNGHTPFSAMVAFCSILIAQLTNKKYVILSNESSANEPSVIGTDINHQYSKSFEFENDFRNYEKEYLKTGISYFSLLRPLNELQIAMLFSRFKKYHDIFRSCNKGSKEDIWCGNCSKCLFVYIILSPFLSKEELLNIFGENLFEKESLKETFSMLIGQTESKPFDCVGTYEEINYAICKSIEIINKQNINIPYLLKYYVDSMLNGDITKASKICEIYEKDLLENFETSNLEENFEKMLKNSLKRN